MDGRRKDFGYDYGVSAHPLVVAAWSGRCSIPVRNMSIHLSAHLSNKARLKVSNVASRMPESLCLEIFPRLDVWPSIFKRSPPTESSIDLFFFTEERDGKVLDSLLIDAIRTNFALKAMIREAELLIFPSVQLPEELHRFQGKFYFWGLFRGKKDALYHESDHDVLIQNSGEKQSLLLNSSEPSPCVDNLGNTKGKEVIKKHLGAKRQLYVPQNHSKTYSTPKRRCSSSSSLNKFVSSEAAKRYAQTYRKRSIIPERGIAGILDDTITAHGWHKLVSHPPEAVIPIVREFYANAKERKDSKVFIRGKWVSFDQNTINKFYNISRTSDEEYMDLCEGRVDPEEIIRVIAYPGTKWKRSQGKVLHFPRSGLLPESNVWHYLISTKLLPSSKLTQVLKKRAILNYEIQRRLPINVGRIIERNFEDILEGPTTASLAYPSLITTLCLNAGVKVLGTEERHKPIDPINAATLARYKSPRTTYLLDDEACQSDPAPHNKSSDSDDSDEAGTSDPALDKECCDDDEAGASAFAPDNSSCDGDEVGPSPTAPDNESCDPSRIAMLQHQLSELRSSVDEMRAHQQRFFEYQVQFNNAMASTLSLVPRTTFPAPPPSFSPASASFTSK